MQVGHSTLRLMTVGMEDRAPTGDELTAMGCFLEEGLAAGAPGLSSGLFTAPGSFARPEELIGLLGIVRRYGGTYATHVRDEAGGVFEAVREAIAAAEAAQVHVQIVHLKLSGTDNWGQAGRLIEEIAAARARGVRVDCDVYPYPSASNPLRTLLPLWVQEGGLAPMLGRLREPVIRRRIAREIEERGLTGFGRIPSWGAVSISTSRTRSRDAGQSVGELARAAGVAPIDLVCDLLAADEGATYVAIFSIDEADVRALLRSPAALVGSGGRAVSRDRVAGQGRPHPRFYGTFPRVIGHYARDLGLMSLATAVFKMTGGSAAALGLADRGLLREGYRADVTVFDPATIIDRATFEEPPQYPAGISTTIVNGGGGGGAGAEEEGLPVDEAAIRLPAEEQPLTAGVAPRRALREREIVDAVVVGIGADAEQDGALRHVREEVVPRGVVSLDEGAGRIDQPVGRGRRPRHEAEQGERDEDAPGATLGYDRTLRGSRASRRPSPM